MNYLFKNIIYLIVALLSLFFVLILFFQQKIYVCVNNLELIKGNLEYLGRYLEMYPSNIILKVEMPSNYEYRIYSDGNNVYLHDLSCNIKLKLDFNFKIIGEIQSKKFFYIIKNNSDIYISAKELEISPGIKEDIVTVYSTQIEDSTKAQDNKIVLVFIRSNKYGGTYISDYELNIYSQFATEYLKSSFVNSLHDLYPYNDSSNYEYYIIKDKYIDIVLEDCTNWECTRAFSVFRDICNNIENANTIIFVILVKDLLLPYSGVAFTADYIKSNLYDKLKFFSGCNAKIITFVQINLAKYKISTLIHEIGHSLANLLDQYLNGCNSFYRIYGSSLIDTIKMLELEYGITCNTLDEKLGAKLAFSISNKIEELYRKYKDLSSLLDKDYFKKNLCTEKNNVLLLYKDNLYIILNISKKDNKYIYDLSRECNIILINETANTIEYDNCFNILTKYNLYIDTYLDQINLIFEFSPEGVCLGNIDIFNIDRDVMYGLSGGIYFSETSLRAFKNNIKKIWG